MKALLLLIFFTLSLFATQTEDTLTYLNKLRVQAGLSPLKYNSILEQAAQNHADYLHDTSTGGHYENNSSFPSSYYTGKIPYDRGVAAGYNASYYSENLSAGQESIYSSVDGLMSAIYHRYGFLDFYIDEIGIGLNINNTKQKIYNYNMGNSLINSLCDQPNSYAPSAGESYYHAYDICANITNLNSKISATLYKEKLNYPASIAPKYTLWPPKNSTLIPPAFFEESPDPLPDYSVSGYPISISFNDYFYKDSNISITQFKLFDSNGVEITNTREFNANNNPNPSHPISPFSFALFPLKRLDFNSFYTVKVSYLLNNIPHNLSWDFKTKPLGYPYYKIQSTPLSLQIQPGKTYALYYPPKDSNDTLTTFTSQYNLAQSPNVSFLDANTILVNASGTESKYLKIITNSGTITLTISKNDTAIVEQKTTPLQLLALHKGWNLISANIELTSIPKALQTLWQYNNNKWSAYTNIPSLQTLFSDNNITILSKIKTDKGTWAYLDANTTLSIQETNTSLPYSYDQTWNLAGTNQDINSSQISCTQGSNDIIWKYTNNSWKIHTSKDVTTKYQLFNTLYKNEGFWVHCL